MSPTVDCTSDETGSFGETLTEKQISINYHYEIELSTIDTSILESEIIPELERAVSDKLLPHFFGEKNCYETRRLLVSGQSKRKLEIVGISAAHSNVVSDQSECGVLYLIKRSIPSIFTFYIFGSSHSLFPFLRF
jgi:hypothetical protein